MAENSSGKKYTVDEILAEYDSMHSDSTENKTSADEEDMSEQVTMPEQNEEEAETQEQSAEEVSDAADEKADDVNENNSGSAEPEGNAENDGDNKDDDIDGDEGIDISDADAPDEQQMINDIIGHIKPVESFTAEPNSKTAEEIFAETDEDNFVSEPEDDEIIEEAQPEVIWDSGTEDAADVEDEGIYIEELEEEPVSEEEVSAEALPDEETEEIFPDDEAEDETQENAEVPDNEQENAEQSDDKPQENTETPDAVTEGEKDVSENDSTAEKKTEEKPVEENAEANAEPQSENTDNAAEKDKLAFIKGIIPWKGDSVFEIIRKIIFIAAVCVFVGAGIMLASTLVQSKKAISDSDEIKSLVTTTVATTVDSEGNIVTIAPTEEEIEEHNFDVMTYYKDINEDVVGFIELEGCDIYQPVVQGDDNDYYLTHTYYDGSNKAGSIFLDYRCRIEDDYTSPNLVVYGHNQEDGTMFGNLKDYKQDVEFYAENPTITFNTEYGVGTYLIYGFFVTNAYANQDSNGEVFRYHDYIETMNDEYTFNWYLKEVQERNQIISPVEVEFGDKLLCLSTCSNEFSNSRFVVFARKLRDGESVSDYDFTEARLNPYARGVDWEAIMSGETTVSETEEETTEEIASETNEEASDTEQTDETTEEKTEETTAPEETEETKKTKKTKKTTAATTVTEGSSDTSNNSILTDESGKPVTTVDTDESGQTVTAVVMTDESGSTVTSVVQTDENGEVVFTTVITDENGETVTAVPENQDGAVTVTGGSR